MTLKQVLSLSLLLASVPSMASDKPTLAFSLDNDGPFGVDQDYTNGLFLSYTTGAVTAPNTLRWLSLSNWRDASLDKYEVVLGHKMYTPSDITATTPQVDDRPYAGYLHAEFNFISLHHQQVQRFNLTLGATGESSLADKAQDIVHAITDSDEPRGWQYQIDDEFASSVGYLTHFSLWRDTAFKRSEWELSSVSEVNVGNFRSDISTGLMVRWGSDLANNMGAANLDTEQPFRAGMIGKSQSAWFVFAGVEARYRFNDMTIEGDRSGVEAYANEKDQDAALYDVNLDHTQATAVMGLAWYTQSFGAAITAAAKTPDYTEAKESVYAAAGFTLYAFF